MTSVRTDTTSSGPTRRWAAVVMILAGIALGFSPLLTKPLSVTSYHVFPAVLFLGPLPLAFPAVFFWIIGFNLFRGRFGVPWWTWAILIASGIGSIVYYSTTESYYAWSIDSPIARLISLLCIALVALALYVAHRLKFFAVTFLAHFLLVLWLSTIAFLYLGEYP